MLRSLLGFLVATSILATATGVSAAILASNDSSFSWTVDTSSRLDWLDFDGGPAPSTVNRSFSDVSTHLGAGGDYAGWRYATRAEVYQFMLNVTGYPSLTPDAASRSENDGATDLVAAWTGYSRRTSEVDIVHGFTGDTTTDGVYYTGLLDYVSESNPPYDFFISGTQVNVTGQYIDLGSWLVRGESSIVSVPPALTLFGLGLALVPRRRKVSHVSIQE